MLQTRIYVLSIKLQKTKQIDSFYNYGNGFLHTYSLVMYIIEKLRNDSSPPVLIKGIYFFHICTNHSILGGHFFTDKQAHCSNTCGSSRPLFSLLTLFLTLIAKTELVKTRFSIIYSLKCQDFQENVQIPLGQKLSYLMISQLFFPLKV